ncbi:hypothetical protein [Phenylobacterium sp.]|uniref:hypothetical protein n=1 Tax=Phenylobacterium sp. TaxID=1871053 RepID=UPI00273314DF|nr:hypothetical protein [Phenylobacterium sp.]MDP3853612.1 hypothetical protein [Phenylobacterium sp.]
MATVHVVLARVNGRADTGATMPIPMSQSTADETVTSTVNSVAVPGLAGELGQCWSLTVTGGNIWARFSSSGDDAGVDVGWLILDGQTREFAVTVAGESLEIKDA